MRNNSKSCTGLVAGFCAFAFPVGLDVSVANAQGATSAAPAINAASRKPQKPAPEKIKIPVNASACKAVLHPGKPYFVEFRSRGAASYGHTFVFYGRLGAPGKFASFKVAGLHPKGDDASTYLMGHWMPVAAETGVSYGDLDEQYLTARFCVTLTEADYNRVVAYIKELQGKHTTWHAPTYNCNSFAADIAKFTGLDTPNPNMYLPDVFITKLGEYNSKKKDAAAAPNIFSQWRTEPPKR